MGDVRQDGFTFFTHHVDRVAGRCTGCGRSLVDLMRSTRWVRNQPTPVCAEADNLRLLERKNDG